jgi:hypothetical protein
MDTYRKFFSCKFIKFIFSWCADPRFPPTLWSVHSRTMENRYITVFLNTVTYSTTFRVSTEFRPTRNSVCLFKVVLLPYNPYLYYTVRNHRKFRWILQNSAKLRVVWCRELYLLSAFLELWFPACLDLCHSPCLSLFLSFSHKVVLTCNVVNRIACMEMNEKPPKLKV